MIASNYQQQYLKTKVETASPGDLTLLLYEELYRKLNMAKSHLQKEQHIEMSERIDGARAILYELLGTLNFDYAIANDLRDLYQFYLGKLNEFVIKKQPDLLDPVIEFAKGFAETWKQAVQISRSGKGN
ncbi:Flagellar secretion chaperone FliS [Paenibacillus sp. JJ-100]|uniref:flagellar export chaperone FliS n=1 Tax=Paenibacillus sp. JJ-100 TaxID=2974896 RepID=UPI0022FF9EE3|nr:flagellar export chaperone FliS [Paenibacillus sp. JJ-100]CAI6081282.1 Flagellar secretion chaperone FliS [Paenibacillus sp. JJ-100]